MRTRRMMLTACAAALAIAVAGCGAAKNTIVPKRGTTTNIRLVLAGPPNALYVGVYDAIALGYYKQSDMKVDITVPSSGQDPLTLVHDYKQQIGVSSEPDVLLRRNQNTPLVSVGAIVQVPLSSVKIKVPKTIVKKSRKRSKGKSGSKTTTKTTTTTTTTTTTLHNLTAPKNAHKILDSKTAPNYQGLTFVVRPGSIVNHAPDLRRFLQTAARGYRYARSHPQRAISLLIQEVPSLAGQKKYLLAELKAFLPHMFPGIPTEGKEKGRPQPWGFADETEWRHFGIWLAKQKLLTNGEALVNASDDELLAGKGV